MELSNTATLLILIMNYVAALRDEVDVKEDCVSVYVKKIERRLRNC